MTLLDKLTNSVEGADTVEGSVTQFVKNLVAEGRVALNEGEDAVDAFLDEVERMASNLAAAIAAHTQRPEEAERPASVTPKAPALHPQTQVVGPPLLAEPSEAAKAQVAPQPQPPPGPEPIPTPAPRPAPIGAAKPAPPPAPPVAPKHAPPAPTHHDHGAQQHKPSGSHKK